LSRRRRVSIPVALVARIDRGRRRLWRRRRTGWRISSCVVKCDGLDTFDFEGPDVAIDVHSNLASSAAEIRTLNRFAVTKVDGISASYGATN
jgi:hypothetical protein